MRRPARTANEGDLMNSTIGRLRRQVIRTAAISGLVLASATTGVIVPGAANAADAPLGTYTVSLDFADKFVQAGRAQTFDLTFTNTSGTTNYLLEQATATLGGFAVSGATATNGWTAAVSGSTVTIKPGLIVNGLLNAQSVTVAITATAPSSSAGNHTFGTTAEGVVGLTGQLTDFDRAGDPPSTVIVGTYADIDTCNAGEDCDTGFSGNPAHTEARAVSNASGTADVVGVVINDDEGSCAGKFKAESKSKAVTVDSIAQDRTVTVYIQLDKAIVNASTPNGAGLASICHESVKPFTDKSGNTVTTGFLPVCPTETAAGPCYVTISKTGAGDFFATIRQPGGDPKSVMGYPVPLT
jgi:hypothetical protein